MTYYKEKTKEELLDIIENLEKQLRVAKSKQAPDNDLLYANGDITRRDHVYDDHKILKLNTVLDNIPIYLFVKDANNDFRYQYCNKAFSDHYGIAAEAAFGRNDFELFGRTESTERFRREDLTLLEKGRLEYEEESTSADGEKHIMITVKNAIFPNPETSYVVGLSWDVTDIRRAEKKIIEARLKAEEADQLKSSFLDNMSHEIRTPLNAIVGFSKLAIDTKFIEEKLNYIDLIEKNSRLLLNLFNDILDFSAIESDSFALISCPVVLHELCCRQYELHRHTVEHGINLIFDHSDKELWINADWERLGQVLSILLNNAIKFTQKGKVHFGYELKEGIVQFYVKDTGIGIPSDKISNIFMRFGKVNDFVQGTGLGLAISRLLVEKMGGRIWVRSKQGEGTTFYFTIPFDQTI